MLWHHITWGVECNAVTQGYVKFVSTPDLDSTRKDLVRAGLHDPRLQPYGLAANHEVLITLSQKETSEAALDQGEKQIIQALNTNAPQDKRDLNNSNRDTIADALVQRDPLHLGVNVGGRYQAEAQKIVDYRDKVKGGVLNSLDELKTVTSPEIVSALQNDFFLSNFGVRGVEIVGPQVGAQLRKQAILAVLYSLAGMLGYLWFRFVLCYDVGAAGLVFFYSFTTIGLFF